MKTKRLYGNESRIPDISERPIGGSFLANSRQEESGIPKAEIPTDKENATGDHVYLTKRRFDKG